MSRDQRRALPRLLLGDAQPGRQDGGAVRRGVARQPRARDGRRPSRTSPSACPARSGRRSPTCRRASRCGSPVSSPRSPPARACSAVPMSRPVAAGLTRMIMRTWRGVVRRPDADRYADYIRETGFHEYGETPGNLGAWLLRRDEGETTEFVTLSLWESPARRSWRSPARTSRPRSSTRRTRSTSSTSRRSPTTTWRTWSRRSDPVEDLDDHPPTPRCRDRSPEVIARHLDQLGACAGRGGRRRRTPRTG